MHVHIETYLINRKVTYKPSWLNRMKECNRPENWPMYDDSVQSIAWNLLWISKLDSPKINLFSSSFDLQSPFFKVIYSKVQCVKVTPFDESAIYLTFFATWVGVANCPLRTSLLLPMFWQKFYHKRPWNLSWKESWSSNHDKYQHSFKWPTDRQTRTLLPKDSFETDN